MAWYTKAGLGFLFLIGVGGFALGTFDIFIQKWKLEAQLNDDSGSNGNGGSSTTNGDASSSK